MRLALADPRIRHAHRHAISGSVGGIAIVEAERIGEVESDGRQGDVDSALRRDVFLQCSPKIFYWVNIEPLDLGAAAEGKLDDALRIRDALGPGPALEVGERHHGRPWDRTVIPSRGDGDDRPGG